MAKYPPEGRSDMPDTVEQLAELLARHVSRKTAIVCVGNELRADDGAGPAVARLLAGAVPWDVYDTGTAPENFLTKIVKGEPDSVVVVDALHLGAEPGTIRALDPDDLTGQGPSTHGPAPLAFLRLLQAMRPCRCTVLGIQPAGTDFGAPMSPPVRRAVELIASAFRRLAGA